MEKELYEISQEEFDQVYEIHKLWLASSGKSGKPADFSKIDLTKINFPSELNLFGVDFTRANLIGTNLSGANLSAARLFRANLFKADLSGANLSEANLNEAILMEANLFNADLRNARLNRTLMIGVKSLDSARLDHADLTETIFTQADLQRSLTNNPAVIDPTKNNRNTDDEKQKKLKELEIERDRLLNENKESNVTIEDKENQIKKLKEELEKRGKDIQSGLTASFDSLVTVNQDIDIEVKRLERLYNIFLWASFLLAGPLIAIWYIAFENLSKIDFAYTRMLLYTCPSLIVVGFICGCVIEMNRAQRQLVSLRKFNRKYSVIKIALEGYYRVLDKIDRSPQKAQETFDSIIQDTIRNDVDIDKEEERIKKMETKDAFLQEKAINKCLSILEAMKK